MGIGVVGATEDSARGGQLLQGRQVARGSVQQGVERVPVFPLQRERAAFQQVLLGLAEG